MSIGERVRAGRKALHLSQEEVARRAGVSLNQVNRLERGEIVDPHFSTLAGLASALDMQISELVGEPAAPLGDALEATKRADGAYTADTAAADEGYEIHDFTLVRDALIDLVNHWEEKLASKNFTRRELDEYDRAARALIPAVGTALQAERNELRRRYGKYWEYRGGESLVWEAVGRFIALGLDIERIYKEHYGERAVPGEAEIRDLREQWRKTKAG